MTIEAKLELFRQLPVPTDLFRGNNFPCRRMPEEVLVFFRGSQREAMNYGDIAQHHRFVLCFCLETQGNVQIDADVFDLNPREGCLIFPYQPHHFTRFMSDEIAWLFISFEMADSEWLEPLRNTVFATSDGVMRLLNQMMENRMVRQGKMLPPQLVLLLERLLNSTPVTRKATASQVAGIQSQLYINLSSTLAFIHQNLDSALKVVDVVEQSGCSETVLRGMFEKYLNTSIAAYIRKMRVLRACHLLATSGKPIGTISDQCGFSSQYAFSRTFKQSTGCSPSSYRRK